MKMNQKGIGHHLLMILVLVLIVVGVIGWLVYKNQKNEQNDSGQTTSIKNEQQTMTQQSNNKESSDTKNIDTNVYELKVTLVKSVDVDGLPSYVPNSFMSYIKNKINNSINEDNGCGGKGLAYNLTKISQVNIRGTVGANVPEGVICPGGSGVLWVLTPGGSWDEIGLQSLPPCRSDNGGIIYEEFEAYCATDLVNRSDYTKNPNGSIKSLAN